MKLIVIIAFVCFQIYAQFSQATNDVFNAAIANKSSLLVVDQSNGKILYEKNGAQQRYPASITKMMTSYLAFKALSEGKIFFEQKLKVSPYAASQIRVKLDLKPGQFITFREALDSMIIKSHNDSAVVIAEALGKGSEAEFVKQMNQAAKLIGMEKTIYKNASGVPHPQQLSSAYDIAKLAIAIQRDYPDLYNLFYNKKQFTFNGQVFKTHNSIHKSFDFPGKTGITNASGYNLVTTANSNGKKIVAVVLGASSSDHRHRQMASLLSKYIEHPKLTLANLNNIEKKNKVLSNKKVASKTIKKTKKNKRKVKNDFV